ncbi:hypothetical protein AKO1_008271 [Acrasis kona]|uniref:Late embryogenesis abundant protein n=1 Tax=Acrasis kona TaxID=1008807 RepID=A0AAW2YN86_9EUKA
MMTEENSKEVEQTLIKDPYQNPFEKQIDNSVFAPVVVEPESDKKESSSTEERNEQAQGLISNVTQGITNIIEKVDVNAVKETVSSVTHSVVDAAAHGYEVAADVSHSVVEQASKLLGLNQQPEKEDKKEEK